MYVDNKYQQKYVKNTLLEDSQPTANKLNNINLIAVFLITVLNAIISGFGIQDTEVRVPGTGVGLTSFLK